MKIYFLIIFTVLFFFGTAAQIKEENIRSKLVRTITALKGKPGLDSAYCYLLKFETNVERKIISLKISLIERNKIVHFNSTNLNGLNFDSLGITSESNVTKKPQKILLPFIIKNIKFSKFPKTENQFSASDIEKIFMLLRNIDFARNKIEILDPLIMFVEPNEY